MALVEEDELGAGIPEWVVTFGDMMSLLMTFFVLLFSMSEIKQEESLALMESLRKQFGHDASIVSPIPGRAPPLNSGMRTLAAMGRARRADTMNGGDKVRAPVGENPRVWALRPPNDSTMGGALYFAEGSAQLRDEQEPTLRQTVAVIGGKPQKIVIGGHTSTGPLPDNSPFRSHWDLAYARCLNVMNRLIEMGIDPKRMQIAVVADNEPVHLGPDPVLRKKNDRVEVLMLDALAHDLGGSGQGDKKNHARPADP